ncbi:MAG: CvpA family protein [Candidatus Andeanibacterium colombiense]|uniref:CvpA family protein n=1 Tax=Candidatus Andeanibacterium colombiense TaxID=3121345 RepID=A0AAJ5X713_9SPHN|nr:MAG: CvpA family protein [Sphingomonadaceae bacterium]
MTGFDIIVLIIVGVGAVGGFLRGFVQEVLSLAAWILALFAIHYLHTPLTDFLSKNVGELPGSALMAFALLLLIPYAGMKLIAGRFGEHARNSILGPIDRVLGFGFGAVKGGIVVVMAFSLLVLGYDSVWGISGRPPWIINARTYPAVNAGSDALVQMIDSRRRDVQASDAGLADR